MAPGAMAPALRLNPYLAGQIPHSFPAYPPHMTRNYGHVSAPPPIGMPMVRAPRPQFYPGMPPSFPGQYPQQGGHGQYPQHGYGRGNMGGYGRGYGYPQGQGGTSRGRGAPRARPPAESIDRGTGERTNSGDRGGPPPGPAQGGFSLGEE